MESDINKCNIDTGAGKISYNELVPYLKKLKDYHFRNQLGIKKGYLINEVSLFRIAVSPDEIINYGDLFLVDAIGNDLSLCKLTKRKYKIDGRLVGFKLIKTIIPDCRKEFGDILNGYWMVPNE